MGGHGDELVLEPVQLTQLGDAALLGGQQLFQPSGLILEYVNVRHGGHFFTGGDAATVIWQHLLWLYGRPVEARVYERASLGAGDRVTGPAIVEQPDTTVLVPEGDVADVDRFGNLLVRREAACVSTP